MSDSKTDGAGVGYPLKVQATPPTSDQQAYAPAGVVAGRKPYGWARTSGPGPEGAPLFLLGESPGRWADFANYIALYTDGVDSVDGTDCPYIARVKDRA